jgi:hypothetical protein
MAQSKSSPGPWSIVKSPIPLATPHEVVDRDGREVARVRCIKDAQAMVAMPALKQACRAAILELRLGIKAGDVPNTPRLRGIVWALKNAADRA